MTLPRFDLYRKSCGCQTPAAWLSPDQGDDTRTEICDFDRAIDNCLPRQHPEIEQSGADNKPVPLQIRPRQQERSCFPTGIPKDAKFNRTRNEKHFSTTKNCYKKRMAYRFAMNVRLRCRGGGGGGGGVWLLGMLSTDMTALSHRSEKYVIHGEVGV